MSFIQKVQLICDADYRNMVLHRKFETIQVSNHDLQVYHIAIRLPVVEIAEIIQGGELYANQT